MYAIGIDVSKSKSTVAIISDGKLLERPFNVEHTESGISNLIKKVENVNKKEIKIVMENTRYLSFTHIVQTIRKRIFRLCRKRFFNKKIFWR